MQRGQTMEDIKLRGRPNLSPVICTHYIREGI